MEAFLILRQLFQSRRNNELYGFEAENAHQNRYSESRP